MKCRIIVLIIALALVVGAITFSIKKHFSDSKEERIYTAYFSSQGVTVNENNEIMKLIEEKTGARCVESWGTGANDQETVNNYIIEGEYPDFISGNAQLKEAGALVPLDSYIDKYPNIKKYLSCVDFESLKQDDGHIYWIPQFGSIKNENVDTTHEGEAFWIQARVLEWAGYPKITTLDEYFDLLEDYREANYCMPDGKTPNIPFTILCDDWKYFCLENVPQFLDGYPNDGSCIVEPKTHTVVDYNTTPTAKLYFKKLNEEYKKGIVDPESFTSTYEEYLEKLKTGAVLGMVDQRWDFYHDIRATFEEEGLSDIGCDYIPLPITISKDVQNKYHVDRSEEFDYATGISVSVSCKDVDGAMKFINDLLDEDVLTLRYWGVLNVDYKIDSDGRFYRTQSQREHRNEKSYMENHFCEYAYFPRFEGLMDDGKNSYLPDTQLSEIQSAMSESVRKCLKAYNAQSFVDILGTNDSPGPWYPIYSYSDTLTYSSKAGTVFNDMDYVKHYWLPVVIMSEDFDAAWEEYMEKYEACHPEVFFAEMQREVNRRVDKAKNK